MGFLLSQTDVCLNPITNTCSDLIYCLILYQFFVKELPGEEVTRIFPYTEDFEQGFCQQS